MSSKRNVFPIDFNPNVFNRGLMEYPDPNQNMKRKMETHKYRNLFKGKLLNRLQLVNIKMQ